MGVHSCVTRKLQLYRILASLSFVAPCIIVFCVTWYLLKKKTRKIYARSWFSEICYALSVLAEIEMYKCMSIMCAIAHMID